MKKMLRGERRHEAMLEGDGKFCNVAAAMIGSAVVGAGASAYSSKKNAKAAAAGSNESSTQKGTEEVKQNGAQNTNQSSTSTSTLDPYISQLLGMNGGGILGSLGSMLNGGSNLSGAGNSFLNANAGQILNNGYAGTNVLMSSQYDAPTMQAAQVRAPSQNGMDLSGAYDRFINGTPGANPYLDQQIGGAIGMNRLGFQQMQDDSNENLLQNVLPSIRGGAIAAGQYGGSRQGIAEGNAIGQQQKELARASAMFGQNATNAAVGAKANAYESDSNRALSATQGLGAQQYGVAQQDAQARQASDMANIQAQLNTRGQNSSNLVSGTQLQQGLLGTAAGYGNADLSRLGQTAGILQPFLNAGATQSNNGMSNTTNNSTSNSTSNSATTGNSSQPYYTSMAGSALGGGLLGAQLGNMFGGFGGNSSATPLQTTGSAGNYHFAPTQLPVQSFGYGR